MGAAGLDPLAPGHPYRRAVRSETSAPSALASLASTKTEGFRRSFDAAQIGLMHVGAVGELLLRQPGRTAERLQIEADSLPHIHLRMAGASLTSAHRL